MKYTDTVKNNQNTSEYSGFLTEHIFPAIKSFEKIGLEELEGSNAALMKRRESKFLIPVDRCPEIISGLKADYRILETGRSTICGYETSYYDDGSFTSFRQHHNGRPNRYKLRVRHYLTSDDRYIEVKQKKNGSTVKNRIQINEGSSNRDEEVRLFMCSSFPYDYHDYQPVLWIGYKRITLVSKKMDERITLDFDLTFSACGRTASFPEVVIGEVKRDRGAGRGGAEEAFKALGIRAGSFSKYCIGISLLYSDLKHNRFKPDLLRLSRIAGGRALC